MNKEVLMVKLLEHGKPACMIICSLSAYIIKTNCTRTVHCVWKHVLHRKGVWKRVSELTTIQNAPMVSTCTSTKSCKGTLKWKNYTHTASNCDILFYMLLRILICYFKSKFTPTSKSPYKIFKYLFLESVNDKNHP